MVGTIFMDLSKAFDTFNHSFLLAKLNACGFFLNTIKFVQIYLSQRFQRQNIYNNFSEWWNTLGSAKGSILGPFSLMAFFLQDVYICNVAHDNSL